MKAAALRGALSDRARGGNVHVLSTAGRRRHPVDQDGDGRAQGGVQRQEHPGGARREDDLGWKSLRNVPEVHLITAGQLNTYDVLVSDDVVFTRQALDEFAGRRQQGVGRRSLESLTSRALE